MNIIGIRSEEKHWESRATISTVDIPLLPVSILLKFQDDGKRHLPFKPRVFSNSEILDAGKEGGARTNIVDELSECQIIIGTKEIKECSQQLSNVENDYLRNDHEILAVTPQLLFEEKLNLLRLSDFLAEHEFVELKKKAANTPLHAVIERLLSAQAKLIKPNTVYIFFSHTHKGQVYNMRMLQELMRKGCTLIDYELLREEKNGLTKRTVAYSRWAGIVGALETLWTYGEHAFRRLGFELPFRKLHSPECYCKKIFEFRSIESVKNIVAKIGQEIRQQGLPLPLRVALTGWRGEAGGGVMEVLTSWGLPLTELSPQQLDDADNSAVDSHKVYLVKLDYDSLYRAREGVELEQSEIRGLIKNGRAGLLESNLDRYFRHIDIFINCITWTPDSPRLLPNAYLHKLSNLRKRERNALLPVIGDITCDPNGSVQCCRDTYPNAPSYIWAPHNREEPILPRHDLKKEPADSSYFDLSRYGFAVMAVTNLPCEMPRDAAVDFSSKFCQQRDSLGGRSYLECLAAADFDANFAECGLPTPLQKATILYRGKFNGANEQILFRELGIAMLRSRVLDARNVLPMDSCDKLSGMTLPA